MVVYFDLLLLGVWRDSSVDFGEPLAEYTCHPNHKRLHYKRFDETQHQIPQRYQVGTRHIPSFDCSKGTFTKPKEGNKIEHFNITILMYIIDMMIDL